MVVSALRAVVWRNFALGEIVRMPINITSAFGEPEDFAAALRVEGFVALLVTDRGEFRAQLTQIALRRLHLAAAEEGLARVAFIAVPSDMVRISFPISGSGAMPVSGGIRLQPGEIMAYAPDEEVHLRTTGAGRWGTILLPTRELARYASALAGAPFALPSGARCWRPPAAAIGRVRSLHAAAIRMARRRPQALIDSQTAQGLEQELIHAVVDCLSGGSAGTITPAVQRGRGIMIRFEKLIRDESDQNVRSAEICAALDVSERLLRDLCSEHLGMSPMSYVRLGRMSRVRSALRSGGREAVSVRDVARQYGFRSPGRFAANYRAAFGESPSTTLKRSSG
jgi:AraC-like DNA-binding protein